MSWRSFLSVGLILLGTIVVAGCGGGATTPESVPDTAVPAEAPTEVPTEAPTEAPTAMPTDTPVRDPEESVRFRWTGEGNLPGDSDDVDDIIGDLRRENEGIKGGFGNEIGVTVLYNPTLLTVEEIIEIFDAAGEPVEVDN